MYGSNDSQNIPPTSKFQYLGSIIQEDGEIEENVMHRIKAGWLKWRNDFGTLFNHKIPLMLKGI